MRVSLNWLRDYVNLENIDIKEFCSKMIMSGSNLDTYDTIGEGVSGVVVGKVLSVEKHPDADKLVICKVDIGSEVLQIVTGAPNVKAGAFLPVATVGSVLPTGENKATEIKAGKLRGVESFGMLCSAQELGFADKVVPLNVKDGLWILNGDWSDALGKDFVKAMDLKDYAVEFEITSNRPDCLSMLGMAGEAKATFDREIKYPNCRFSTSQESAKDYIDVQVKSPLCKRYIARVIKDVKIEQSPWWMQKRLMSAGMRPINNIVDITNFVMLEFGQPLHAFDINSLAGNKIVVDMAAEGEQFTTLDGTQRRLDEDVLMINDGEKAVAIAGIMGGLNSEITDDTRVMVLESANFEASSVRLSSKRLGLRTESSGRYEKGIDPNLCKLAADRVCQLIDELGYGTVLKDEIDIYNEVYTSPTITVRVSRINKVIGTDLSREEMVSILEKLDIKVEGDGDDMIVTPPTVRQDLLKEVDYIEEIARIYGYNNIPMTFPSEVTPEIKSDSWILREKARDILCGLGLNEIQTFSFINHKTLDAMNIDEDSWERSLVELINPMGEDTAAMRTILSAGMLEVLGRNYSRNIEGLRAFEIGNTFTKNYADEGALPDETLNLSIGMYGEEEDFFTLKGIVEEFLNTIGFDRVIFQKESEYGLYHPGRCSRVLVDISGDKKSNRENMLAELEGRLAACDNSIGADELSAMREMVSSLSKGMDRGPVEIGIMGEIHPDVLENFGIGQRAYCGEFIFDLIVELANKEIAYKPLPKFPAMTRDIAVIVDEQIPVGDLEQTIRKYPSDIIERVKIFDIYRGRQVEEGKKSVALSITYRHRDKTLTDEETSKVHGEILNKLETEFKAVLRDM